MNIKTLEVASCLGCEGSLTFGNALSSKSVNSPSDGKIFMFACSRCSEVSRYFFSNQDLLEIKRHVDEKTYEEDLKAQKLDKQFIGNIVHGFRIDLDAVVDLGDLLLEWDYADKAKWTEVPRETDEYAPLPRPGVIEDK